MSALEFIFSSPWHFLGTLLLIGAVGTWFPLISRGDNNEFHNHKHYDQEPTP